MSFTLISHGNRNLRVASSDGHVFLFEVTATGGTRNVALGGVEWPDDRQPGDVTAVLVHASSFARACAEDFGLI